MASARDSLTQVDSDGFSGRRLPTVAAAMLPPAVTEDGKIAWLRTHGRLLRRRG